MTGKTIRKFAETIEFRSDWFRRIQRHRYFPWAAIVTILLLASLVHVWQRVMVLSLVKEVGQLNVENQSLVDAAKKVQSDLSALTLATRVERYAKDTLKLQPVEGDRLYTLVPRSSDERTDDDLTTMLSTLQRVAEHLPVITETRAHARELEAIRFEPSDGEGAGQ